MRIRKGRPARRPRKVPKTFRLVPEKIAAAQRILRTRTATETIEKAIDLVVFRDELVRGTLRMSGTPIEKTGE